jgi:hypothetical protein
MTRSRRFVALAMIPLTVACGAARRSGGDSNTLALSHAQLKIL